MTQTSFLRVFGVLAIAMLLAVSSVAFAQTDTTYADDGTMQTTSATDGTGGAGDATTPGVPNTGTGADPIAVTLLAVAAVAVIGGAAYLLMTPRDIADQI